MARLPPLPGLLKLDSKWTLDSQSWSTAFWVLKAVAAAWSGADIAAVLTALAGGISTNILPLLGTASTNTENVGTDLSSDMGLVATDAGAGTGTGAGTAPLPINVALRATIPSVMQYRGGRPGQSWAGLDQTNRLAGSATMWTVITHSQWQTALENMTTVLGSVTLPSGATASRVWVSYHSGHVVRPVPLALPVTAGTMEVQQRICTRRRRLGRGVAGE